MWGSLQAGGGGSENWDVYCTLNETSQKTFDLGFKPKKLYVSFGYTNNAAPVCLYDEDVSTTTYQRYYSGAVATQQLGAVVGLQSIDASGFTINSGTGNPKYMFYAAKR